jgi:hypothetical protein
MMDPEALPELAWVPYCNGMVLAGMIDGDTAVVVSTTPGPNGKHAVRWVAPKQEPQPFMMRSTLPAAVALAERVLRLKRRIR